MRHVNGNKVYNCTQKRCVTTALLYRLLVIKEQFHSVLYDAILLRNYIQVYINQYLAL